MKSKVLKISILMVFCFILLSLTINLIFQNVYVKKINENVINIISVVKEKYPNITDEEIVNILNNKEKNTYDLDKFGIYSEDINMLENTKFVLNILIFINVLLTLFLGIILLFLLIKYIKKRKSKVYEITEYIKKINKKKYDLKLDENNEDELSLLYNELYKTTIFLKEQSENAKIDKMNIKNAMSDISHQLKTPLTSIMIGVDNIIENENMDYETRNEFLMDIKKKTDDINFLITSILKLSRFSANVIKFDKSEINVKVLINDVLKNLNNILKIKNANIEINGKEDITFYGDYKWELEAITNIVKNGIEHLKENGIIKISFRKLSIYTEIIIEDNGIGIDSKDLKHIFERFYKGVNSSSDSIGIGLSLAKKIIETDSGYIKVISNLGIGTKFIIRYMK